MIEDAIYRRDNDPSESSSAETGRGVLQVATRLTIASLDLFNRGT